MASKKSRLGQYLEWHHGRIRVTVPVPKALQSSVGSTRLKRPLQTDSPANAERIKHAVIHELKAIIAAADKPREGIVAEALGWRQDLEALGDRERETLELVMVDRAEEIEAKAGLPAAREFVAIANGEATPISDHRASAAYRTAMLGSSLRKFYAENPGNTDRALAAAGKEA